MTRIVTFTTFLIASATASLAAVEGPIARVPEIDAASGLAALGVVGAIATMMWERRRRG